MRKLYLSLIFAVIYFQDLTVQKVCKDVNYESIYYINQYIVLIIKTEKLGSYFQQIMSLQSTIK